MKKFFMLAIVLVLCRVLIAQQVQVLNTPIKQSFDSFVNSIQPRCSKLYNQSVHGSLKQVCGRCSFAGFNNCLLTVTEDEVGTNQIGSVELNIPQLGADRSNVALRIAESIKEKYKIQYKIDTSKDGWGVVIKTYWFYMGDVTIRIDDYNNNRYSNLRIESDPYIYDMSVFYFINRVKKINQDDL